MATPNQYAGELTGLATAPAAAKLEVQIVERFELSTKAGEPSKKLPLVNLENDQLFEIAKHVASQRKLDAREEDDSILRTKWERTDQSMREVCEA